MKPAIYAVIPVLNESEAIRSVVEELAEVLATISSRYLITVVDDGSTDGTAAVLRALESPSVAPIILARRTGQAVAIQAGLDRIPDWADIVVTMDGDGQDDPADLSRLVDEIVADRSDMVLGWRRTRAENVLLRQIPSRAANRLIAAATGVAVHDFGSPLKAIRADVARAVQLRADMHRFIPAMGHLAGARVSEIVVAQRARRGGRSKYGLSRTGKVILDLIALTFLMRYADRPMRLFGSIALVLAAIGTVLGLYIGIERIAFSVPLLSRPFFPIAIFLYLSAIIVVANGLTAELLSQSVHRREQRAPAYLVRTDADTTPDA